MGTVLDIVKFHFARVLNYVTRKRNYTVNGSQIRVVRDDLNRCGRQPTATDPFDGPHLAIYGRAFNLLANAGFQLRQQGHLSATSKCYRDLGFRVNSLLLVHRFTPGYKLSLLRSF
jgi:hypothetical protein